MRREILRAAARAGLLAGIVVVFESLVGMVEKFASLAIVGTRGTLNWVLILLPPALAGYLSVRSRVVAGEQVETPTSTALVAGAVAGLGAGAVAAAFIGVVNVIGVATVQTVFVQVSQALMGILTFHMGTWAGTALLAALLTVLGIAGAGLQVVRPSVRRPILNGLTTVLVMGLLQRVVPPSLDQIGIDRSLFYSSRSLGLTPWGALIVFVAAAAVTVSGVVPRLRRLLTERPAASSADDADHPLGRRMPAHTLALIIAWILLAILLVVLPYLVGTVVSQILGTIGIYLLLGLGLNIVVGFAGLLDLGYVAFFAVGAYLTAILTGGERVGVLGFTPPAFGAHLSFFVALPIVMIVAALIGVLIGAPVLRLRGDYLAIVTLGFGEIARVIFGSDWAGPLFGGALGMTHVTGAPILGFNFQEDARHFYYLVLFFCLIAIYVSYRLQGSRVGRAWNAMREDEQVADAMGYIDDALQAARLRDGRRDRVRRGCPVRRPDRILDDRHLPGARVDHRSRPDHPGRTRKRARRDRRSPGSDRLAGGALGIRGLPAVDLRRGADRDHAPSTSGLGSECPTQPRASRGRTRPGRVGEDDSRG